MTFWIFNPALLSVNSFFTMNSLQELRSGKLKGSTRIKLACGLTAFPSELFSLEESLEIMDLSGNALNSLPDDFARFTKLKIAFFPIICLRSCLPCYRSANSSV